MIERVMISVKNHDGMIATTTTTPMEIERYKGGSLLNDIYTTLCDKIKADADAKKPRLPK